MGNRKRDEIIDEKNIVDSSRNREAIVRIGRRFGMTHSAAVAACYLAYLLHKRSKAMRKRGLTVGEVFTAAVKQDKAIDFRFVPMSAEDERKFAKMSHAGRLKEADAMMERVFGPILKELGLNKEEHMEQYKPVRDSASIRRYRARARKALLKRPKVQLVTDLEALMHDNLLLRDRVKELEHAAAAEDSIGLKTEKAARWLADQFVREVNRTCGRSPDVDDDESEKTRSALTRALQDVARGSRVEIVVQIEGEGVNGTLCGALRKDGSLDFAAALKRGMQGHADQMVASFGALPLLVMALRERDRK